MKLTTELGSSELLSNLTKDEIQFLESVANEHELAADTVLFEEDSPATHFYIVVKGRVGLELVSPRRLPIVIQTLGPGDLVGLSWYFPPHSWSWRARALDDTTVVSFDANLVRERCSQDQNLSEQILRVVAREAVSRLHATRAQLLDLYELPK